MSKSERPDTTEEFLKEIWADGVMSAEEKRDYDNRYRDALTNSDICFVEFEKSARKAQVSSLLDMIEKEIELCREQDNDGHIEIMSDSAVILVITKITGRYYVHIPSGTYETSSDGLPRDNPLGIEGAHFLASDLYEHWCRVCLDDIHDMTPLIGYVLDCRSQGTAPEPEQPDTTREPEQPDIASEPPEISSEPDTTRKPEQPDIASEPPGQGESCFIAELRKIFEDGVVEDHELLSLEQARMSAGLTRSRAFALMQRESCRALCKLMKLGRPDITMSKKLDSAGNKVMFVFKDSDDRVCLLLRMTPERAEIFLKPSGDKAPPEHLKLKKVSGGDGKFWGGLLSSLRDLNHVPGLI